MLQASNIAYEMSQRIRAIGYGGVGAIHTLVCGLELDRLINERVKLLKFHVPYFESDHVLSMAYNILTGGQCLEDIERLRLKGKITVLSFGDADIMGGNR